MIRLASIMVIFFCAGILLTSSTRPPVPLTDHAGIIVLRKDNGGEVSAHIKFYNRIARAHIPVRVESYCISACTFALKMPLGQVCLTPGSSLGFHLMSTNGQPDRPFTRMMLPHVYPKAVLNWIHSHPLRPDVQMVKAADAVRLGFAVWCKK